MVTASAVMEPPSTATAPVHNPAGAPYVRPPTASLPSIVIPPSAPAPASPTLIDIEHLDFFYGPSQALNDISLKIDAHKVTAFIGPSGCGKST